jgi:hypothetical protein
MIDRHARDLAADAVREFMNGSISNREFERRFTRSAGDPALWAIYDALWYCYSDVRKHTLTGKHALNDDWRAIFERCLLFLRSDLEFQWAPPKYSLWYGFLRLLGFGRIVEQRETEARSIGDVEVWPFLKKAEYDEAAVRLASL